MGSSFNEYEYKKTILLLNEIKKDSRIDIEKDVSIITFYNAQKYILQKAFEKEFKNKKKVETVDSFQGKENEIIIINMVRTKKTGFVNDAQRLNVALTRAKSYLFIIGDKKFWENKYWENKYWVGQGMFDLNCIETRIG